MLCILEPLIPTQAPTGSIRSSKDSTATLALSPGSRTTFLIAMIPSNISGTSLSNNLSKKVGEVLERITLGALFCKSIRCTTALIYSPFLKLSLGICSNLGKKSSFFLHQAK